MQRYIRILTILSAMLIFSAGVSAFSISSVTYTIGNDGNGTVDMQYQLNDTEKLQYDLITKALDLKAIGKSELEKTLHRNVTVTSLNPDSLSMIAIDMAKVEGNTMTTPEFTYLPVESLVDPSLLWIVKKFDINFIPHTSTIVFPDGFNKTFTDIKTIPSLNHTLAT